MRKKGKPPVTLRVSTALKNMADAACDYRIQDVIHEGIVYRILDAHYYAWIRCRMDRAKKAFEAGKLPEGAWQILRGNFLTVHEWALKYLGEKTLLDAIANLDEESYRSPSCERVASLVESWDERAAIMEHDGGLNRNAAEQSAAECISRELTPEDVESFKALGVEVHVKSKPGDFTLVPEYTDRAGQDRIEISAEDMRKLSMITHTFPGTEITYVGPQQEIPGEPYVPQSAPAPETKSKPQPPQPKLTQPPQQARLF